MASSACISPPFRVWQCSCVDHEGPPSEAACVAHGGWTLNTGFYQNIAEYCTLLRLRSCLTVVSLLCCRALRRVQPKPSLTQCYRHNTDACCVSAHDDLIAESASRCLKGDAPATRPLMVTFSVVVQRTSHCSAQRASANMLIWSPSIAWVATRTRPLTQTKALRSFMCARPLRISALLVAPPFPRAYASPLLARQIVQRRSGRELRLVRHDRQRPRV